MTGGYHQTFISFVLNLWFRQNRHVIILMKEMVSHMFIYLSDRMAEIMKKEVYVKESEIEITSTVEDKCFNIPEEDIKLENTDIKDKFTILKA